MGVIQGHDGHVSVDTQMGKGTTFEVYFPVLEAFSTVSDPSPLPSTSQLVPQKQKTILLVDDDDTIRELVCEGLVSCGYGVLSADNGITALATFQENAGDIGLIVLDVQMPLMDGIDVIHYIKKMNTNIPIILATGYSTVDLEPVIAKYTNIHFFSKPYTISKLIEKMETLSLLT